MILILIFLILISSKPIISGYFGIFDDAYNSTMNVSKLIPWTIFDRINIAFANVDNNAHLINERSTDIPKIFKIIKLYKKARPDGKVFISLYYDRVERMMYAANHTKIFSESVIRYLKRYKIDGIDLDWETVFINKYRDNLITLLKSCYGKIRITHTIWPYVHTPETVGLLANVVDQINIMSYGFSGNTIEALIKQYNNSGFPYEKLVLGMDTELEFETKETISDKLKLIKKYNLAGIFVWRLDNDDINNDVPTFKTTQMLHDVLQNTSQKTRL